MPRQLRGGLCDNAVTQDGLPEPVSRRGSKGANSEDFAMELEMNVQRKPEMRRVQQMSDAGKQNQYADETRSLTCRCTVAAEASFAWLRQFSAAAR